MQIKKLGDVAEYINGRAFKPAEWEKEGLPIIRIQNLTNTSKDINRTTKKYEEKYLVKNGDLLFAWSASLGAYIWNGGEAWLNQHIFKIIPNDNIEKKYLYYFLLQVIDELYSKTHGSGMVHITLKPFKSTAIPVPDIAEQQRIVQRIEALFAKLDEAQEKLQNVLDSFETRKAAILHKAFTGALTANWRQAHGITLDSWEEKTLGEVASTQYGYTESASYEPIGPKFLRITDIQDGVVNWNEVPYCKITEEELKKYFLSAGDIVIARTGATTGKSYLIRDDVQSVFASYLIRLKLNRKDVLADFIYQFMQCPLYWEQITDFSKGIAQPGVNAQKLKEVKLLFPPLDEQTEIVRIVDNLLAKEQQAQALAQNALAQIALIKKSILARAFRGALATNNPADEPAIELLGRVL